MIYDQIQDDIIKSFKAGEKMRTNTLKSLKTAFINELVATKRMPTDTLKEEEALTVIAREAKKRKDSAEQFTNGGRGELAEIELQELKILQEYLPEMMPENEVREIVEAKKQELKIVDPAQKGMLMGAVMGKLKGKADGAVVKKVVDDLFRKQ